MKKTILIGILIVGMFLISGCANITGQALVCNKPYIQVGTECCLDKGDNGICDRDETDISTEKQDELKDSTDNKDVVEEASCSDECSSDSCEGNMYITCLKQSDGCKDKVSKRKVGKCGVECISHDDCGLNGECKDYKCKEKVTSSGECTTDADCGTEQFCLECPMDIPLTSYKNGETYCVDYGTDFGFDGDVGRLSEGLNTLYVNVGESVTYTLHIFNRHPLTRRYLDIEQIYLDCKLKEYYDNALNDQVSYTIGGMSVTPLIVIEPKNTPGDKVVRYVVTCTNKIGQTNEKRITIIIKYS